jgi:hypothetical protein
MTKPGALIPVEQLEQVILSVRGQRVILDADLADLYGVTTRRLNEQVRRNADRFPDDFAFRLTRQEFAILKSQNATSNSGPGGRRTLPMVFTEHGAVMAANVLSSKVAVAASTSRNGPVHNDTGVTRPECHRATASRRAL